MSKMENLKMQESWGMHFTDVAKKAKEMAESVLCAPKGQNVEFEFNDRIVVVSPTTNLTHLSRDFDNSWIMDWKIIGPDCVQEYPAALQADMKQRRKVAAEEAKKREEQYRRKEAQEKADFEAKVKGIEIQLKDPVAWKRTREANKDPYGNAACEYAEGWAKLMQVEMASGKKLSDCAKDTSFELGFLGITGFMYGAAVSMLSQCWKHGEELRKWHNNDYGHQGDGVVNPAVLTIKK